jgi:hypothetical protein
MSAKAIALRSIPVATSKKLRAADALGDAALRAQWPDVAAILSNY